MARFSTLMATLAALAILVTAPGCSTMGADCRTHSDCSGDEFCCTEDSCNRGMCTDYCSSDRDCASDMVCRDGKYCLFSCTDDRDCAGGFKCKEKDGKLMCTGT